MATKLVSNRVIYSFRIANGTGVAYTSGDIVGAQVTLTGFPRHGRILKYWFTDDNAGFTSGDLVLSTISASLPADNAVYSMSDAEVLGVIAVLRASSATSFVNNNFVTNNPASATLATVMPNEFMLPTATINTVYASMITRSTPTPAAASGVNWNLIVERL